MSDFTHILNYNNPANFTIDANAEVTTKAKLKKLFDATSWVTYTNDINLNYGGGVRTGTPIGGASVVGGKLDLSHSDIRYVDYDPTLNADNAQTGCIRCRFIPNFTGAPATYQVFVCISDLSTKNRLFLSLTPTGNIHLLLFDENAAVLIDDNTIAVSPVAGVMHEMEFNYDITTGVQRLFLDGNIIGTWNAVGVRDSSTMTIFRVGNNELAIKASNFFLEDMTVFDSVQHTANYTPNFPIPELPFSLTPQSIIDLAGVETDGVDSLVEGTIVTPANTERRYNANVGLVDYWYDGAAWAVSSGFAESNTIADFNDNIASFNLMPGSVLRRKLWLSSTDGLNTPTIETLSMSYDYYEGSDAQSFCLIKGYAKDNGVPIPGAVITFKTTEVYGSGNNSTSINERITSRTNGYYEKNLVQGAEVDCKMTWTDANGKNQSKEGTFTVPLETTKTLEDLL